MLGPLYVPTWPGSHRGTPGSSIDHPRQFCVVKQYPYLFQPPSPCSVMSNCSIHASYTSQEVTPHYLRDIWFRYHGLDARIFSKYNSKFMDSLSCTDLQRSKQLCVGISCAALPMTFWFRKTNWSRFIIIIRLFPFTYLQLNHLFCLFLTWATLVYFFIPV